MSIGADPVSETGGAIRSTVISECTWFKIIKGDRAEIATSGNGKRNLVCRIAWSEVEWGGAAAKRGMVR